MGHTNNEKSDCEGSELKDIVKDEESHVDLNKKTFFVSLNFFFRFLIFALLYVLHHNQEMRLFLHSNVWRIFSAMFQSIMDENWIVIVCFVKYV